jgi:CHAT domain-containing protein
VCTGRSSALLVGVEDAPGMPRLHTIRQEPDAVSEALAQGSIAAERREGADATVAAVARDLSRASMVHLACHGVQDTQRPLDSGFCLADGRLTIARLMDLHMPRAFLAFLSACETAKGDPLQMDEAIHLSSALLFAGFNSVIATMWSVVSHGRRARFLIAHASGRCTTRMARS